MYVYIYYYYYCFHLLKLTKNGELNVQVRNGRWFGDAFIFTTQNNRLCYFVGGELVTLSLLDRPLYLLGYLPKENRVFLCDRELKVDVFFKKEKYEI